MPGIVTASLLAGLSFGLTANAKELKRATNNTYVVHSSVSFIVGGEHVPIVGYDDAGKLTSLGANQMYQQGANFRQRYITADPSRYVTPQAPIQELSTLVADYDGLTVWSPNDQSFVASAQAFLQGLYPPTNLSDDLIDALDPQGILSNGTYLSFPLNGYQYPQINSISFLDPNYIYLSGGTQCDAQTRSQVNIPDEWEWQQFGKDAADLFASMSTYLTSVFPLYSLDFANAGLIYQYMSYQYNHNQTVYNDLKERPYATNIERLKIMSFLEQYALYGNYTADSDQIRSIAGKTLAAKVVGLMSTNIASGGQYNKLALLFGDVEPVIAFLSISRVYSFAKNLWTLPEPGASLMFELFSWQNSTGVNDFPSVDDLWVRFLFRSGPDPSNQTLAYPLFGNGPSMTDIPYTAFVQEMSEFMVSDPGQWCSMCNATSVWCQTFMEADGFLDSPSTSGGSTARDSDMTPQVAGVIGAAVTLGVTLIAFLLLIFLFGMRFAWTKRSRKNSELGGFKGSAKLASDADLTGPKSSATTTVAAAPMKPRVGSWELNSNKDLEIGQFGSLGTLGETGKRRPSFEEDAPEDIDLGKKPTVPDERV